MNGAERSMLHDALAEAAADYTRDPTPEGRLVLTGMRYVVGLLGMPEGHSDYLWCEPGADTESRRTRRLGVIRNAAAHRRRRRQP